MIRYDPCRLCVFDLDHTLSTCNAGMWLYRTLRRQPIFSMKQRLSAYGYRAWRALARPAPTELHRSLFRAFLQGLSLPYLERLAERCVDEFLLPTLRPAVVERLRWAQHRGVPVVLLSSSPLFLVQRVAEALEFDEWAATEYTVDQSNHLTGIRRFLSGRSKAEVLKRICRQRDVAMNAVVAFSDSVWDLPLLMLCGYPIAVQPDLELRRFATRNQWLIL